MENRLGPPTASDAALIGRTRLGDDAAFEALTRRHRAALGDLARLLTDRPVPLANDTFAEAYRAVRGMQGPHSWVRGYLLQLMCRLQGHPPAPDADVEEPGRARTQRPPQPYDAVVDAFSALAEAWQAVVWHSTAEREASTEVAAVVGVSSDKVGLLVGSARTELRRSLLTRRWQQDLPGPCRAHLRRLMDSSPSGTPRSVLRHAARCPGCAGAVVDLDAVRHTLPEVLARHLVGEVGDAYLDVRRSHAGYRLNAL